MLSGHDKKGSGQREAVEREFDSVCIHHRPGAFVRGLSNNVNVHVHFPCLCHIEAKAVLPDFMIRSLLGKILDLENSEDPGLKSAAERQLSTPICKMLGSLGHAPDFFCSK